MNKKTKINLEKCFIIFTAIAAFLRMRPYFTWNTTGIVSIMINLGFTAIACAFGIVCLERRIKRAYLLSALYVIAFSIYTCATGIMSKSSMINIIAMYLLIVLLILQSNQIKEQVFLLYFKIFAVFLIPGIVYSVLLLFGIDLPYNTLQPANELKVLVGHYYRQYPGAVFYCKGASVIFCGVFDEPGVVGTFSALLLVARMMIALGKELKDKILFFDVIVFISGILSQSKAFIIIIIFAIIFKLLMIHNYKTAIGIAVFTVIFLIIMNVDTGINSIERIKVLLRLYEETGNVNLLRASQRAEATFSEFFNGPTNKVLFGNGFMASQQVTDLAGTAEIRILIYDLGILGVVFLLLWIILSSMSFTQHRYPLLSWLWMFVIAFILSIVQRQYITSLDYMVILFGGIAYISDSVEINTI